MGKNEVECQICKQMTEEPHRHHTTPKSCGGTNKGTIVCCPTCNGQIHMLFTNKELAKMSIEELLKTEEMKKYVSWKKRHFNDYGFKPSAKIKRWSKGHR